MIVYSLQYGSEGILQLQDFLLPLSGGEPQSIGTLDKGWMRRWTNIPQGPPRYRQCGVIREDDQGTLWHIDGPLELVQLEEVLEPAPHPQHDYQREDPAP